MARLSRKQRLRRSAGAWAAAQEGAPEWLPEGAGAYSDFVNGNYYVDGEETTLEAMWDETSDWAHFDPARVVNGVGLRDNGSGTASPVYVSGGYLGGYTAVLRFTVTASADDQIEVAAYDLPDQNQTWRFLAWATDEMSIQNNSFTKAELLNPLTAGEYCVAFTMLPTGQAGSYNGNAVVTNTQTAGAVNSILLSAAGTGTIREITFYEPRPNAELPALSAL